jgi:ATP-binding cassette, subfamily B, bacterial
MLSLFLRFRGFLHPYRIRLSIALLALAGSVAAALAEPWPLKVLVDSVLGNHPFPAWVPAFIRDGSDDAQIAGLALATVVIVGIGGALEYFGTYWAQSMGQRMVFDIREAVHAHIHRLSLEYHHSQRPGDLVSRLTADVERIQSVIVSVIVTLVTSALLLVGMLAIMFVISWQFTLLALVAVPVLALTIFHYTRQIKFASRSARRQEGRVAAMALESLTAIQLVQAYTREQHEFERFSEEARESLGFGIDASKLQARFGPLVDFVNAIAVAIVLWVGAHGVISGALTLGLLLVFLSYLRSFYKPLKQLSKLSYLVSRGTASAERLADILATEPSLTVPTNPYRAPAPKGRVVLDRVSFTYPLGDEAALHEVSFAAQPGETVALVGRTGAGKSTIAGLIPRFYDADSGSLLIDGVDVRQWDLKALRSNISLVLQDTWIFQASVLENILYGRPGATRAEVIEAAIAANADDFIGRLPGGYDAIVGPRGATLSGGQRQGIAIARAILRAAPILILDEPTTGLDGASEQLVLDALRRLSADRTTIVISHSEGPVIAADSVLVVKQGRIVERGSHAELQNVGTHYPRLRALGSSRA